MTETITSRKNPRVQAAVGLRESRHRRETGRILIDGHRELVRALDAGVKIEEVFTCSDHLRMPEAEKQLLLDRIQRAGAVRIEAIASVFEQICFGDRNDGVVAIATRPPLALTDLRLPSDALIAIVEHVEKPGNLGAILRSADGAGVSAVLVADPGTDIYGPNVIRASLGAIFCVPTVTATVPEIKSRLAASGVQRITARPEARRIYTEIDYTGPTAVIFGSKAHGLSDAWSGPDITAVKVPMLGRVDSLNVATTAAILFYEAIRQRMARSPRTP